MKRQWEGEDSELVLFEGPRYSQQVSPVLKQEDSELVLFEGPRYS